MTTTLTSSYEEDVKEKWSISEEKAPGLDSQKKSAAAGDALSQVKLTTVLYLAHLKQGFQILVVHGHGDSYADDETVQHRPGKKAGQHPQAKQYQQDRGTGAGDQKYRLTSQEVVDGSEVRFLMG